MAFVVFCHFKVSFLTTYIYWFHMPLFFILSGYLHKQPGSFSEILFVIVQKTYRFFVPYTAYYFLIWFGMRAYFQMPLAFTKRFKYVFIWRRGFKGISWGVLVYYGVIRYRSDIFICLNDKMRHNAVRSYYVLLCP